MGIAKYIRESWNNPTPEAAALWKARLPVWRREESTVRLEHPTRLDAARRLGYRAKPGLFVVRQRVSMGTHRRPNFAGGRHSSNNQTRMTLGMNYQQICEQRANDIYPNCEVLNSYFVAKDGKHYWYEVILADRGHPQIKADPQLGWMASVRGRVYRGLTSAARKSRGLRRKGKGAEKVRQSYHPRIDHPTRRSS